MASQRNKPAKPAPAAKASATGWGFWVRMGVTVLVLWHLAVLFLSPLSVAPPTSELARRVAQSPLMRWYSDPLYLNHGYNFFGPEPPMGGQLIRYEVYGDDDRIIKQGEFPNLDQQWPRLWYHRHMMLTDQMAGAAVTGDPQRDKQLMMQAYARHLIRKHEGARARLENLFHRSLWPEDVRAGITADDPRNYETLMTIEQSRLDLDAPLVTPPPEQEPLPEEIMMGVGE